MKKGWMIFLALLSACAAPADRPYRYTLRDLGNDEYEIVMHGDKGLSADALKGFFQVHARGLCDKKVYLLRGLREDFFPEGGYTVLTGEINCVGLDYFK